jgi:hypothetical protein
MEVDLQAVRRMFEDVLNGCMLREQADRWAYAVVQEEETGVVTRRLSKGNAFGPV